MKWSEQVWGLPPRIVVGLGKGGWGIVFQTDRRQRGTVKVREGCKTVRQKNALKIEG